MIMGSYQHNGKGIIIIKIMGNKMLFLPGNWQKINSHNWPIISRHTEYRLNDWLPIRHRVIPGKTALENLFTAAAWNSQDISDNINS